MFPTNGDLTPLLVEGALPISTICTFERDSVRSFADLDGISHFSRHRIYHRYRIVHDVADEGAFSIIADHDAMRALSGHDGRNHAVIGCIYHRHSVIGIGFRTLIGDIDIMSVRRGEDLNRIAANCDGSDLLTLRRVDHGDVILISQGDIGPTTIRVKLTCTGALPTGMRITSLDWATSITDTLLSLTFAT